MSKQSLESKQSLNSSEGKQSLNSSEGKQSLNSLEGNNVFYISSLDDLKDKKIGKDDIIFVKDNVKLYIYLTNNYDKYNLKNEFKINFLSSLKI